ncbi:cytochrome P450 [Streptomyces chryseus]
MPRHDTAPTELPRPNQELAVRTSSLLLGLRRSNDPTVQHRALRALGPVLPTLWGAFLVTDLNVARAILTDPAFRSPDAEWRDAYTPGWRHHSSLRALFQSVIGMDSPQHTRMRGSFATVLNSKVLASLVPEIHRISHNCLDTVAHDIRTCGQADFTTLAARLFPAQVLCAWLGLPQDDAPQLLDLGLKAALSNELSPTEAELDVADTAIDALHAYWQSIINRHRIRPEDSLLGSWLTDSHLTADPTFDDEALICTLITVFIAGYETAATTLAHACAALALHPDQHTALRDDPDRAPAAVENLLRARLPGLITTRTARHDLTLAGLPIPAGQLVHLLLAPDDTDLAHFVTGPATSPGSHLAFGAGTRYCLGARLARLELGIFLPALAERFPHLHLTKPVTIPRGSISLPAAPHVHITT